MVPRLPILTLSLFFVVATRAARPNYGQTYTGVATYYGIPSVVNCALPNNYLGLQTVALNGPQYQGSCGMCLMVDAPGVGLGRDPIEGQFMVAVTDSCFDTPDQFGVCGTGHLDFAKPGDGRWDISWKPVPCPTAAVKIRFEGSNPYYIKAQSRYMDSPMSSMKLNGVSNTRLTNDHFFEFQSNAADGWGFPLDIEVKTALGQTYSASISRSSFGNDKEYPTSGGGSGGGGGDISPRRKKPNCSFPTSGKRGGEVSLMVVNRRSSTIRVFKKSRTGNVFRKGAVKSDKTGSFTVRKGSSLVIVDRSGDCLSQFKISNESAGSKTVTIR